MRHVANAKKWCPRTDTGSATDGERTMDKNEHDRLERKMKRAKREAEDLEDDILKEFEGEKNARC